MLCGAGADYPPPRKPPRIASRQPSDNASRPRLVASIPIISIRKEEEHDQSCGYIREDQVESTGGQRQTDEWSNKSRQDEEETATSTQPGPWSPGPHLWMTPPLVGHVASGGGSQEEIILRWRWHWRVGRRRAWLRSSRKLAWCARLHAAGDTEGRPRCQRVPAGGAEALLRLMVHGLPAFRSAFPERGFLYFERQYTMQTFSMYSFVSRKVPHEE
jgi:hypothetical protein